MEELIERIYKKGSVLDARGGFTMTDMDSIIKQLDKEGKFNENIIFCSEKFLEDFKKEFDVSGAVGYFKKREFSALDYLAEFGFRRGTYEFWCVVKPNIKGAVVVPTYQRPIGSLSRNSVIIETDE